MAGGIRMRYSRFILLIVAIAALPVFAGRGAAADGTESLVRSVDEILIGGGVVSEGVGLSGRQLDPPQSGHPGAITIDGIPNGNSVARALLYWTVLGSPDDAVNFAGGAVSGAAIGSSVDSWSCGFSHAARNYSYRADVTASVPGNGVYPIAGVGDDPGNDAQGASLVVLHEDPDASTVTRVVINDGAITAGNIGDGVPGGGFEDVFTVFSDLAIPATLHSARLHVGFGDGQGTPGPLNPGAGPLRFRGAELAPSGFLAATDGPLWDDQTFDVPTSTLPSGTQLADVTLNSGDDCIVWTYALLELGLPDMFGPRVEAIPDRSPSSFGWYDGPVTIHWDVRDPNGATQPPDTVASTEGKDVLYTSAPSCDELGNCATGSVKLSIDRGAPHGQIEPQEFPIVESLPSGNVRIFDQWISGSASDSLSGIATVLVEAEGLTTGERSTLTLQELRCDQDARSCDFRVQLPDAHDAYRVWVTAIDRAGNADPSPVEAIVVLPPDPFGGECPLPLLCE